MKSKIEINKDIPNNEYFTEAIEQEYESVMQVIGAILKAQSTASLDEKRQSLIDTMPEILTTSSELKHTPEFIDMTFEDFIKCQAFKDLIVKAVKDKFAVDITIDSPAIEFLKSIIPSTFYITNNKLSNEITKDFVNKGEQELIVIRNTRKKGDIITYNTLTYDDKNISITGRHVFTAYDRTVHNAVCSLYVAGNDTMTPAMVYRTMTGMSETEYISPKALETVRNSIDKSRFLKLTVDFTEEAKARNMDIKKAKIEDYLLNAKKIWVKTTNNEVEAYKINATPTLYQYAQTTNQILSIPLKLLDTKEATRNTEEIIPIKEYLVRRIEIMKHDKTMSNKILYGTIFEEVGIVITDKKQKTRMREYITSILSLWKIRDNYINDFKEYKERNSIKGVEIFVNKRR